MGLSISKFFSDFVSKHKQKFKILMLGLDAAGKTTILQKLKFNVTPMTVPTIGFNMETIQHKNLSMDIWDIGGQDKIRILWKHYYQSASAVIFVVDSTDQERLSVAKYALYQVLNDQETQQIPVLIYANKQDVSTISLNKISEQLGLADLKNRKYLLQGCCALTGEGMIEGLDWLNDQFKK